MATDWSKLTVVDLRAQLKKRGLPQTGKKADLVDRLGNAEREEAEGEEPAEEETHDGEATLTSAKGPSPEPAEKTDSGAAETLREESGLSKELVPSPPPQALAASPVDQTVTEATVLPAELPEPSQQETQGDVEGSTGEVKPPVLEKSAPPANEIVEDVRGRKRRSRSPPPSGGGESRKRMRQDEMDTTIIDAHRTNGVIPSREEALPLREQEPIAQESSTEAKHADDADTQQQQPIHAPQHEASPRPLDTTGPSPLVSEPEPTLPTQTALDHATLEPPPAAEGPSAVVPEFEEKPVVPAVHPATSALYIKNFMRPLRTPMVQEHLVKLATPPGTSPKPDVVVDFYLDQIRTHSFVNFSSTSAASRVRSALHDQVWPDERNRKALWVDFIPPEKAREWAEKEMAGTGGRGSTYRWEVIYEQDGEGNTVAKHEEVSAESLRQNNVRPPPGPAAEPIIPTGPSRSNVGIEGAPLGPRRNGGRGGGRSRVQPPAVPGEGWEATRAGPSLLYKPVPEDLARLRLRNMRSFYSTDRYRPLGREDEINRYTFENSDAFVDRGKEVFIGIRPPHRERERQRRGGGGSFGGPRGPPPPPRSRNDRYVGGGGGGSRRDDFVPRSRLDGAPLPTFGGRSDRSGRSNYRSYRP